MRIILSSILGLALSASAFAYPEGSFTCKTQEDLPLDNYKITNVSVAGSTLPFVEIDRYFRSPEGKPPRHSNIRGFATVSVGENNAGPVEYLGLAALILEFRGGRLVGCKLP